MNKSPTFTSFELKVMPQAFKYAGIELEFKGSGIDEKGIDKKTKKRIITKKKYYTRFRVFKR